MDFGLPKLTIEQIRVCFSKYPDIEWVKIYGSRALSTYHPGSDVDLAFCGTVDHSSHSGLSGWHKYIPAQSG
jgi:hypothetical protein